MIIDSGAYARAGLLGNPGDGYFGKTLSVSIKILVLTFYYTSRLN